MLTSMSNRNTVAIMELRLCPQKTPGKTRCFYRHFWKQKRGTSFDRQSVMRTLRRSICLSLTIARSKFSACFSRADQAPTNVPSDILASRGGKRQESLPPAKRLTRTHGRGEPWLRRGLAGYCRRNSPWLACAGARARDARMSATNQSDPIGIPLDLGRLLLLSWVDRLGSEAGLVLNGNGSTGSSYHLGSDRVPHGRIR